VDFLITEEERFRQQVRSFLDKELPPDWEDYTGTAIDDTVAPREDGGESWPLVGYLIFWRKWHVAAGTSEILKNIIALSGQKLPRE
jgi:hypothetical protein